MGAYNDKNGSGISPSVTKTGWAKGAEKQNADYNEEGRTQIGMRISCQEYR